ncbi:MAG: precorrin-6A synthase (deacetylating) [Desulfobacter postgatei]|uniref:Precorrin-6A synthase (Deacetylating) n=1 Tax=Desulfobacter postgatei TaxID=2293 RepID=A0A2G6MSU9_9BACT|nr:MAG: precorrin-6A synthase (deacetylating) [Desulfobacter postgatei]
MVKRQVKIIGIGLGNPGHLTGHAIAALRQVNVFLIADKGDAKKEMVAARKAVCEAFLEPGSYDFVKISDMDRGPDAKRGAADYRKGVQIWRQARVSSYVRAIKALPPNKVVGFLAWGDPGFYDSLIGIVKEIGRIIPLDVRVIPGISAIQALAAENVICLNRVAAPIHITTGRRLPGEWSPELGTVVVMLDKGLACAQLVERAPDLEIVWGAYIGFPWQIIRRGRLADMIHELIPLREKLRRKHGWIMDTYILRGPEMTDDTPPLEI